MLLKSIVLLRLLPMSKNWWRKNWDEARASEGRSRRSFRRQAFGGSSKAPHFVIPAEQWPTVICALEDPEYFRAVVVERHKKVVWVGAWEEGSWNVHRPIPAVVGGKYRQLPRKQRDLIAVGDEVICCGAAPEDRDSLSYLLHRRERRNTLERSEVHRPGPGREQVLGANVDQLAVVSSFYQPRIFWQLIDRYLVWGALEKLKVVLIFTKKDLLPASSDTSVDQKYEEEAQQRIQHYRHLGWMTYQVNAHDPQELSDLWRQKISFLSGLSGVGKSTLVNSCGGRIERKVGLSSAFGTHTTSSTRLIALRAGGMVMDSPGIQSLEPPPSLRSEFYRGFPEFASYAQQCHFPGCTHREEPCCAVRQAVEQGFIAPWRYLSYVSLYQQALDYEKKSSRFS